MDEIVYSIRRIDQNELRQPKSQGVDTEIAAKQITFESASKLDDRLSTVPIINI